MSYEKEEDERSEINRDRLGGEGVLDTHRMAYSSLLTPHLFAPPHHYVVPIDFAALIFFLLVRQSINKFILCPYFVRRFPL